MSKRRGRPSASRPALPLSYDSDKPAEHAPRPDMPIWECPNCGQNYFGAHPPDLCDYCRDFTTWRPVKAG